ncbi:Endolytic peptidoglycan transglycosylase RlpA [Gammaproteobacteria bacterium]
MGYSAVVETGTARRANGQVKTDAQWWRFGLVVVVCVAGCSSQPPALTPTTPSSELRDAIPRIEPRSKYGNPAVYDANGRRYYTLTSAQGYVERGVASWYGPGFHGKRTSSGEPYDMNAMTAAHTTLPLPTYVYVTNLENGRTAILRVNDRGPFEKNRLIDLSLSGAKKLGLDKPGTALVEVQALDAANPESWPSGATTLVAAATGGGTTTESTAATSSAMPVAVAAKVSVPTPHSSSPSPASSFDGDSAALPHPTLYLQVGAFSNFDNAERLRQRLTDAVLVNCAISSTQTTTQQTLYRLRLGPLDSVESADRLMEPLARLGIHDPRIVVD